MRAFLIIPALFALTACSQAEVEALGFKNDQIIAESGGYKLVLGNGVCYEVDETRDDNRAQLTRVNPARCGI